MRDRQRINEKKTKKLFGYTSNSLLPNSGKRVISNCLICKKDREITFSAYRDVCKKCDSGKRMRRLNTTRCRAGINNSFYGKHHSEETKKKLSLANSGKNNWHYGKPPLHGKHVEYIDPNGNIIKMRSTWEGKVAEYLDKLRMRWEFESKVLPIEYRFNGKQKMGTFIVDFWIPTKRRIIEVKGRWRDDAREKFEAAKSQYPQFDFVLFDKMKLKELNIL